MSKNIFVRAAVALSMLVSVFCSALPYAQAIPAAVTMPNLVLQAAADIPNMSIVAPNLYRGGMPNEEALEQLQRSGIKTIVSLANEKKYVEWERAATKRLGLKFVHIPLSAWKEPSQNDIEAFLTVVAKKDREPVFVHCVHGRDRTGTMVAIYRINNERWSADSAYEEMKARGFRTFFMSLKKSVFDFAERKQDQMAVTALGS